MGPELPPQPPRRGRLKLVIAAGTAVAVLAGGGAAAYAYTMLASTGTQPEQVLPRTAVAFAKLDLDPAASQKIAAYRLAKKFPGLTKGAGNIGGVQDSALSQLFADSNLNFSTDVKPWLGSRAAVAAVPDAHSDSGLDPVLAVAFTDEAKMRAALAKVRATAPDFGFVTVKGFALISDSQAHADALPAEVAAGNLAGSPDFKADVKSLHGNQIALGWADLGKVDTALKNSPTAAGLSGYNLAASSLSTGRIVIGAHANADYLEVTGKIHGAVNADLGKPVDDSMVHLPADTTVAVQVSGLGPALAGAWNKSGANPGREQLEQLIGGSGLQLPADFTALLGSQTLFAAHLKRGEQPDLSAQATVTDAPKAIQIVQTLVEQFGLDPELLHASATKHGFAVGTSAAYNAAVGSGSGALGASPAFIAALPNAKGASLLGYVDVGALLDADDTTTAQDRTNFGKLGSLGISVTPTPDGASLTVRLTTR